MQAPVLFDVERLPDKETPLMRQYNELKRQYPHTLILFRIGDFYETFGEDAITASRILGIVLTRRANGAASHIELAGFPHHSLNLYLPRLVQAGQRVAICDQLEDPKLAKGLVKRGVTDIVTPGIAFSDQLLNHQRNNYLAAVCLVEGGFGAAFADVSTGDFFTASGTRLLLEKLLFSLRPAEVLLPRRDVAAFTDSFAEDFNTYRLEDWAFEHAHGYQQLTRHFGTLNLKGFGLEEDALGTACAGALLTYLAQNQQHQLGHLQRIYRWEEQQHLALDRYSLRNLELLQPLHPDGRSVVQSIDRTCTSMGARLLKRWLAFPLLEVTAIEARLTQVQALVDDRPLAAELDTRLREIADLERLLARLATRRLTPREAVTFRNSLRELAPLYNVLVSDADAAFRARIDALPQHTPALERLEHALHDEAGHTVAKGNAIGRGVSAELDELRELKTDSESALKAIQQREVLRTGIQSLKVGYNKVFGYYLEITHAHRDRVPPDYIRKQTLTGAERYITPELKTFEEKVLSAEERILALETDLYNRLLDDLQPYIGALQQHATVVAEMDVLRSFAELAVERTYTRPALRSETGIVIEGGRHPVIEQLLPPESPYVPNDVRLNADSDQILLISGPNMAGKSALLRQVALIQLLAQVGSFVPASRAELGVVDKIFTRVGASDNLAAGESTFMVEMTEAARILNTATHRSLVLLDELGRGTSTFDGVSIAWAITEYLHEHIGALTLFATHYHELAALADEYPRVRNWNVGVREIGGKVIFLRKLQPGHSAHSFGINVAQMAGLPPAVVARARQLLQHFEAHAPNSHADPHRPLPPSVNTMQPPAQATQLLEELTLLNVDRLTPLEALLKLQEWQTRLL
jgi:DNA mismatch repair protein MutS